MALFREYQDLENPTYEDLTSLTRCLHIEELRESIKHQMLVPADVHNSNKLRSKVLWFAPTQPMFKHNQYGNGSIVIEWEKVFDKMGSKLYLIDQAIFNRRGFTRVLLTNNSPNGLQEVDLNKCGSPLIKERGRYKHASECKCINVSNGSHELQIAIEPRDDDEKWLYSNSTIYANDHLLANTEFPNGQYGKYESFCCYKYNTAQKSECPYAFGLKRTEELLKSFKIDYGDLSEREDNSDEDQVDSVKVFDVEKDKGEDKEGNVIDNENDSDSSDAEENCGEDKKPDSDDSDSEEEL